MADASGFAGDFQLTEVIPAPARVPTLADSGSILARQKVSMFPSSVQDQTIPAGSSGSPFIFKLSDTKAYADLRSAHLETELIITTYSYAVTSPAGFAWQYAGFDESALACIKRIRVLVAGALAEDIQDVNIISQVRKMMTFSNDNQVDALIAGGVKYNFSQLGANSAAAPYDKTSIAVRMQNVYMNGYYNDGPFPITEPSGGTVAAPTALNQTLNTRVKVSIPLRLISGLFNTKQWWYLRNASIQIELYPEIPSEALVQFSPVPASSGDGAVPDTRTYYSFSQAQIRMDTYTLDPEIVGMIDSVIMKNGLAYGYETTTTMINSFAGSNISLPFNKAVSDATQFCFLAQPQSISNDLSYYGLTTWRMPNLDDCQLQIGSTPLPVNTMNKQCRKNMWYQMWNGDAVDQLSCGQVPPLALDTYNRDLYATNGTGATGTPAVATQASPAKLQGIGIPLRRVNVEGVYYVNAGYNTGLDAGVMTIKFTKDAESGLNYIGYAFLQYVRLITLAAGRVDVSA